MNEFLERATPRATPGSPTRSSAFRDYRFEDEAAGDGVPRAARGARPAARARALPGAARRALPGTRAADYETAQQIRERIEALERSRRAIWRRGTSKQISPGAAARPAGGGGGALPDPAARPGAGMRARGLPARSGDRPELTPRAIRRIGAHALAEVYAGAAKRTARCMHETDVRGRRLPRPDETKPFSSGIPSTSTWCARCSTP